MGFVYEVAVRGVLLGVPIANIFHIWDGDEDATTADVADLFEDNLLADLVPTTVDELTYTEIVVTPMDFVNPANPLSRPISITGNVNDEATPPGTHVWAKFQSDDAGEKGGGKMFAGLSEPMITDGILDVATMAAYQVIMNAFLGDLTTAGLALAIYRPTLSIPGEPEISTVSEILVRGLSTNNRRFPGFSA